VLPDQGYRSLQGAVIGRLVGSNSGMMISKGNPKKLGEKFAPM
jgi:hypothetical protein